MTPWLRRARRAVHQPGFGGLAAERERGQGVGAQVDGEDLHHGQRQRDRPAGQGEDQERHDLGDGVGEDVADELADVVVDPAARLDGGGDGGEVVVGEDHGGRLAGDVGARAAHGDADVGAAQRGRVVDPVAGHGHDLALGPQRVGDAQLCFGRAAGEDDLGSGAEQLVEVVLGHRVQLAAGDHAHPAGADADAAGDRGGGQPVVAGDDVDADAGPVRALDRGGDLGPRRVEHGGQPEQAQVPLCVFALTGERARPAGSGAAARAQARAGRCCA